VRRPSGEPLSGHGLAGEERARRRALAEVLDPERAERDLVPVVLQADVAAALLAEAGHRRELALLDERVPLGPASRDSTTFSPLSQCSTRSPSTTMRASFHEPTAATFFAAGATSAYSEPDEVSGLLPSWWTWSSSTWYSGPVRQG
jgi:hypothetical protein